MEDMGLDIIIMIIKITIVDSNVRKFNPIMLIITHMNKRSTELSGI